MPTQVRTNSKNEDDSLLVPGSFQVLQPSIVPMHYYDSRVADPFFFGILANLLGRTQTRTVFTTSTSVSTATVNLFFTTGTKPFIIQGCTPSPLPFPTC